MLLGEGSFGSVRKTGSDVASKFATEKDAAAVLMEEYDVLKSLHVHPSVVNVHSLSEWDGKSCVMNMELLHWTLRDRVIATPTTPETAVRIATSLLEALRYIHSKGYVHCDVKPANMGFRSAASTRVVLFDFGNAYPTGSNASSGTYEYMPPEVLEAAMTSAEIIARPETDIWSAGCVIAEVLGRRSLWEFVPGADGERLRRMARRKHPDLSRFGPEWAEVLEKMLERDPTRRASADELLRHPLFDECSEECRLFDACWCGNAEIAIPLVNARNINSRDSDGFTPLHIACKRSHAPLALALIACGADPASSSNFGCSVIDAACASGSRPLVSALSALLRDHRSLISACKYGDLDLVADLVLSGADVNATDASGFSPLHAACASGRADIVSALVKSHHANIDVVDRDGSSPLHIACYHGHFDAASSLVNLGARSSADHSGNTPLHNASLHGHIMIVMLMATRFPLSINAVNSSKQTPLHLACFGGHVTITMVLCDFGSDIDVSDLRGDTPLHVAVRRGMDDTAYFLVSRGANIDILNASGIPAWRASSSNDMPPIILQRKHHQADITTSNQRRLIARTRARRIDAFSKLRAASSDPSKPKSSQ